MSNGEPETELFWGSWVDQPVQLSTKLLQVIIWNYGKYQSTVDIAEGDGVFILYSTSTLAVSNPKSDGKKAYKRWIVRFPTLRLPLWSVFTESGKVNGIRWSTEVSDFACISLLLQDFSVKLVVFLFQARIQKRHRISAKFFSHAATSVEETAALVPTCPLNQQTYSRRDRNLR